MPVARGKRAGSCSSRKRLAQSPVTSRMASPLPDAPASENVTATHYYWRTTLAFLFLMAYQAKQRRPADSSFDSGPRRLVNPLAKKATARPDCVQTLLLEQSSKTSSLDYFFRFSFFFIKRGMLQVFLPRWAARLRVCARVCVFFSA